MKTILIALLMIPGIAFAQEMQFPINPETHKVEYTELVWLIQFSLVICYSPAPRNEW